MEPKYASNKRPKSSANLTRSAAPQPYEEEYKQLAEFLREKLKEKMRPETGVTSSAVYYDSDMPKYKLSVQTKAVLDKNFDYTKKFSTLPKKSDPVSRMQELNKAWKKSPFLKANTAGRKHDVSERLKLLEPKGIFAESYAKAIHKKK